MQTLAGPSVTESGSRASWPTFLVAATVVSTTLTILVVGDPMVRIVVLVVAAALAAIYATVMHPQSILAAFAIVLGSLPFAHLPHTKIQIVLVLCLGVWFAVAFLPGASFQPGWPELAVAMFVAVSVLSAFVTGMSMDTVQELAAWIASTAVVVPLRFLPTYAQRRMVRTFVVSAGVAGGLGIALVTVDPTGSLLGRLTFAGYQAGELAAHFVFGSNGTSIRLAGTFVEPNLAGIVLAAALLLTLGYFSGWARIALVSITGVALLLTLSRTALATTVVAGVLLTLRAGWRERKWLLGAASLSCAMGLAIPVVRHRLLDSFGPSDTGSQARGAALREFPEMMSGHWWWGIGWVREEFREVVATYAVNPVANSPLLTIYRAGLVVGVVGVVILIAVAVQAWSATTGDFRRQVVACTVLGFVLVALQLDIPVVLQAPGTALFSFLVALLLARDAEPAEDRVPRGGW